MHYLITDQNNKSWRDIQWDNNTTHSEDNENYYFVVFNTPHLASYMYPYYGGNNPKLWQCNGEQNVTESNITTTFKKLTTIKEVELKLPTDQQKITFAILTSLNIVNNPQYKTWAINYLKGIDQSKESANLMKDLDLDIDTDLCILIVIEAVLTDDVPDVFVALAAHRAYYDALDVSINIDLNQIAQIVNMLDPKDIADSFE